MMDLQQLQQSLPGSELVGDPHQVVTRVHSDTRSLQPGDLFVALRGDNFDGNRFLAQARAAGAVGAIAHDRAALEQAGLAGVVVADSKLALGIVATRWRARFTLPLIAVTGSNGKTTVTQMLAAILWQWKPQAMLATLGNFNNDIGLPLTLLRLRAKHAVGVVELGMNHPGEIALLATMARPTVALVNNAQREHLEFMASVEAVAHENGAVISALPADGIAVFPHDDPFAVLWRALAGARKCLTFAIADAGTATPADISARAPHWADGAWQVQAQTPVGALGFTLRMAGRHNVRNALAATACAVAVGVPPEHIATGLQCFEPVKGRSRTLQVRLGAHACTLVDDSYNANPDSVDAALEMLAALPGPRLMVLGDMGEVGDQGPQFHVQAGARAQALGIESLLTLGSLSASAATSFDGARHCATMPELVQAVLEQAPAMASILVKGARFMRMEQVVEAVMARARLLPASTGEAACC